MIQIGRRPLASFSLESNSKFLELSSNSLLVATLEAGPGVPLHISLDVEHAGSGLVVVTVESLFTVSVDSELLVLRELYDFVFLSLNEIGKDLEFFVAEMSFNSV